MHSLQGEFLFKKYNITAEGKGKVEALQEYFETLLMEIKGICPEGRELSLVRTKLEEASFFATKGVAKANQV